MAGDSMKTQVTESFNEDEFSIGDIVQVNQTGEIGTIKSIDLDNQTFRIEVGDGDRIIKAKYDDISPHDSEADNSEEEDSSEIEANQFFVAVYDEDEHYSWIGIVSRNDSTKWHESPYKGKVDHRWGGSYMSYLTPDDIMQWIRKDYRRGYEVAGPFDTAGEAEQYVKYNWGKIDESQKGWLKSAIKTKGDPRPTETRGKIFEPELGWLTEGMELQYEMMLQNGKIERFIASSKDEAIKKANVKKAKSLIRLSKDFIPVRKPIPLNKDSALTTALKRDLSRPEPGSKLDLKIKKHNADVKAGGKGLFVEPPEGFKFKKDKTLVLEAKVAEGYVVKNGSKFMRESPANVKEAFMPNKIQGFIPPFSVSGNWINDSKGRGICEMGESRDALKHIAAALNAYCEKTPVKEAKQFTDYDDWKQAVLLSYPAQAKKIKFRGRIEGTKNTISAEIPGEDRSYGVWDNDTENGVILSEVKEIEEGFSPYKPNSRVKIVGGPVDVRGLEGFIGEIKTDASGKRTFVVDISDGSAKATRSVTLLPKDVRLVRVKN